jgi:hypothetical protein
MSNYPATGPYAKPPAKQKSYWFRWVCLGLGLISCVGFIIAACRIQTRRFAVAAVVAVVASAAAFAAVELDPTFDTASAENSDNTAIRDFGFGFWLVVVIWAALVIYALILQPEFKRFLKAEDAAAYARWDTNRATASHTQSAWQPNVASAPRPSPAAPPRTPPGTQDGGLGAHADNYLAMGPLGNSPSPTPPNAPPRNGTSHEQS